MSRANPTTTHGNAGIAAWNFKLAAEIGSYEDCAAFLDTDNTIAVSERDLGPRMVVTRNLDDGYCAVRLYDTEIIRYYPDGTFSVDNGGHHTVTTKYRLEAVLPDGFTAYHHKKQLGLYKMSDPDRGWGSKGLWPLDHSVRITP